MLEDTYGHTPAKKAFELWDVYGVGYDEQRANRKPLKIGIIGAGGVTQSKHLPAFWRLKTLWEPVEVTAIVKRDERSGTKVAEMYNCHFYKDHNEMLKNEELDGVIIASPDDNHYEHTMACLEKDIHVLVEKPITRSLVQSEEMCRTADTRNLVLMTVANKRYSPPIEGLRSWLTKGQ